MMSTNLYTMEAFEVDDLIEVHEVACLTEHGHLNVNATAAPPNNVMSVMNGNPGSKLDVI